MKITIEEKLKLLSNTELVQLTNELKQTSVPADALLRKVIQDTELDTTAPLLAFVGVGQWLAFELADRLIIEMKKYERLLDSQDRCVLDM